MQANKYLNVKDFKNNDFDENSKENLCENVCQNLCENLKENSNENNEIGDDFCKLFFKEILNIAMSGDNDELTCLKINDHLELKDQKIVRCLVE